MANSQKGNGLYCTNTTNVAKRQTKSVAVLFENVNIINFVSCAGNEVRILLVLLPRLLRPLAILSI